MVLETAEGGLGDEDVVLDVRRRELRGEGWQAPLTPCELELMRLLLTAPGAVHSRHELATQLYGDHQSSQARNVDAHVNRLRHKLPAAVAARIHGVYGGGYRWQPQEAGAGGLE
jgi:DNA-binding response OmpR family regulator